MTSKIKLKQTNWRFYIVITIFCIGVIVLIGRLFTLTIYKQVFLAGQGNSRSLRVADIHSFRGMITDRNGDTLAVSIPVFAVWANPKVFNSENEKLPTLAKLLNIDILDIKDKISKNKTRGFIYLGRNVDPYTADKIKNLGVEGCYLQQEYKRYYPHGEVTSQILGFNNIDDHGQEGLELFYDSWLSGIPGKRKVHKNIYGQIIEDLGVIKQQKPGKDLILSIDIRIQSIAHNALLDAMAKYQLKSGSIVVLDANTGEVLAMVNAPTFNPNIRMTQLIGQQRNRAVTDLFELGSVMKPFLVAAALDSDKYNADTIVDTSPGWMVVGGHTIRDLAYYGKITVKNLLKKSSNVGIVRMLKEIKPESYTDLLKRAGVSELTYVGFPGERSGTILEQKSFNHTLAVLTMGYSVSMTPLQLARAFSIFRGSGKLLPVSLLKSNQKDNSEQQVISDKTSKEMLDILEITKRGTTRRANIPGYRLAAKTGTARLLGNSGYDANRHVASTVGLGPISSPKLIVAVVLNDPQGKDYYGGVIAAPVFATVMSESFRLLQIPRDRA